jgi:hypothetical protein
VSVSLILHQGAERGGVTVGRSLMSHYDMGSHYIDIAGLVMIEASQIFSGLGRRRWKVQPAYCGHTVPERVST